MVSFFKKMAVAAGSALLLSNFASAQSFSTSLVTITSDGVGVTVSEVLVPISATVATTSSAYDNSTATTTTSSAPTTSAPVDDFPTTLSEIIEAIVNAFLDALLNPDDEQTGYNLLLDIINIFLEFFASVINDLLSALFGSFTLVKRQNTVSVEEWTAIAEKFKASLAAFEASPKSDEFYEKLSQLSNYFDISKAEANVVAALGPLFQAVQLQLTKLAADYPELAATISEFSAALSSLLSKIRVAIESTPTGSASSGVSSTGVPTGASTGVVPTTIITTSTTKTYVIGPTETVTITKCTKCIETVVPTFTTTTTVSDGKTVTVTEPCEVTVTVDDCTTSYKGGVTVTVTEPVVKPTHKPGPSSTTKVTVIGDKTLTVIVPCEECATKAPGPAPTKGPDASETTYYTTYTKTYGDKTVTVVEPCETGPVPTTVTKYTTHKPTDGTVVITVPKEVTVYTPVPPVTIYTTSPSVKDGKTVIVTVPCETVQPSTLTIISSGKVTEGGKTITVTKSHTSVEKPVTTVYSTISKPEGPTSTPVSVVYPCTEGTCTVPYVPKPTSPEGEHKPEGPAPGPGGEHKPEGPAPGPGGEHKPEAPGPAPEGGKPEAPGPAPEGGKPEGPAPVAPVAPGEPSGGLEQVNGASSLSTGISALVAVALGALFI